MKISWSDAGIDFPETDKIISVLNEWYSDGYLEADEVEEKICAEDATEIANMFSKEEWINIFHKLENINCDVWYPEQNEPILVGVVRLLCTYVEIEK